jgi:trk system potassium uptake protein TrkH
MIPRRRPSSTGAQQAGHSQRFRLRRGRQSTGPRIFQIGEGPAPNGVPSFRQSAQRFIFALVMLLGASTILLATPWTTASGDPTPIIDAAFTAISAACITGLVTLDTQTHWNGFGKAIILVLMQVGTLGFMVGASLVLQVLRRGASLRDALLMRDGEPTLTLREVRALTAHILRFTLLVQAIGATAITIGFLPDHSVPDAIWHGVFLSVSAFSNACFDLTGGFQSLIPYQGVVWFNLVIIALIQAGALGYLILSDVWRERRWRRFALDTKLVLTSHLTLLILGAACFLFLELGGAMASAPDWAKPMISLFQSVSTRSGGFATVDLGQAGAATLFLFAILMMIGGAPASTAGGVRLTTVAVVVVAVLSTLRGQNEPQVMGRRLETPLIYRALTVIVLFMMIHGLTTILLYVTENHFGGADFGFMALLFESASALATDGPSTGITPSLTDAGKLVLCATMFVGRIGPLTAVFALQQRQRPARYRFPAEPVRIG